MDNEQLFRDVMNTDQAPSLEAPILIAYWTNNGSQHVVAFQVSSLTFVTSDGHTFTYKMGNILDDLKFRMKVDFKRFSYAKVLQIQKATHNKRKKNEAKKKLKRQKTHVCNDES